ncbi:MAG: hypothetical protein JWO51_125 [Rhodospirillales bacterium]|nr:hypothetical protein [Rhodospirillales bacterium]
MIKVTRIMSSAEHCALGDDAVARGFYRNDRRIFTPGMAWYMDWYWDPTGERERAGKNVMFKEVDRGRIGFLSVHFWRDWADKRPPICVVCPNGECWEIDRKSSNGDGWAVSGDLSGDSPSITCSPSIVVDGYHGFLGCNGAPPGQFTGDLEGRGPTGLAR